MKSFSFIIAVSFSAFALSEILAQDNSAKPPKVDKQDVFSKAEAKKQTKNHEPPEVGVLVEYISVDHATANSLVVKFAPNAGDVQELRDTLEKMLDAGTAELDETMWLRSRSSQRAKTESVTVYQYATGYDPPSIPNTVGAVVVEGADNEEGPRMHMAHATPAEFEYRNLGSTLETDLVIAEDESLIDINLAPEIVKKIADQYFTRDGMEDTAYGVDHITMPLFYTIKDTTQLVVTPGKYNLFGFHTPHDDPTKRIFVILRADLIPFVFGK